MSNCPHCRADLTRSCILDVSPNTSSLLCTACDQRHDIPKLHRQTVLTCGRHGSACATQKIDAIHQIGFGDLIRQEVRSAGGERQFQFGVCTELDRLRNRLTLVELRQASRTGRETRVTLENLRENEAIVYRFLPLDCLRLHETLRRARSSVSGGEGNCESGETFANWLKTGSEAAITIDCIGVANSCPHCNAGFWRSSLLSRSNERLQLVCGACEQRYEVSDSPEQRSQLEELPDRPDKVERLTSIDQLGASDIFMQRNLHQMDLPINHHMVCVARRGTLVRFVHLQHDTGSVEESSVEFGALAENEAEVFRYLPLDCLPRAETLSLTKHFKGQPFKGNCMDFALLCKCGESSKVRPIHLRSGWLFILAAASSVGLFWRFLGGRHLGFFRLPDAPWSPFPCDFFQLPDVDMLAGWYHGLWWLSPNVSVQEPLKIYLWA